MNGSKETTSEGGALPACPPPFILTALPAFYTQSPALSAPAGTQGEATGPLFHSTLRTYSTEGKEQRLTPNTTHTVQGASRGARGPAEVGPGPSSPRSCPSPPGEAPPELKPGEQRRVQKPLEPCQPVSYKATGSSPLKSHQARPLPQSCPATRTGRCKTRTPDQHSESLRRWEIGK